MQPQALAGLGAVFAFVYFVCVIGVILWVLNLLGRFVAAHERMAESLERISRKFKDSAEP